MTFSTDKYTVPLTGLNLLKPITERIATGFVESNDLDALAARKKWHNNIPLDDDMRDQIGPMAEYLKDEILVLTIFPSLNINIHADGAGTRPENTYNVSINIPVYNCTTQTVTQFWDFPDQRPIDYVHYEKMGTRDIVDKDQLVRAHAFSLTDTPVLFRNEYPHSVENDFDQLRVLLSWRFLPDVTWEQATDLCRQSGWIN